MKRLFIIASLAILAVGCQKTEIQNEVQTPIGFSTEVGKQTRAIVDGANYGTTQPFAVYAYGHQGDATATVVMNNVEISYTAGSGEGTTAVPAKWSATGTTKYYWPNDPNTYINFYAYSPAAMTSNGNNAPGDHQILHFLNGEGNGVSHSETTGLTLTKYDHSNKYVDFMVAKPVLRAKYATTDPDNLTTNTEDAGTVPVVFEHKMSQILFKVTTAEDYPGIKFTVKSITLNDIKKTADYTSYTNTWTTGETIDDYPIFPAKTSEGASSANPLENGVEKVIVLTYDNNVRGEMLTTGVTMIPQTMQSDVQAFTIVYDVEGTGVAKETVTKKVFLYKDGATLNSWGVNQKITYTVKIGLNEILFAPTVVDWDSQTGTEYTFQQ